MFTQIQKGFILIKLMVDVAIIGILAAVVIPAYQDYTKGAVIVRSFQEASVYKMKVVNCMNKGNHRIFCTSGTNGVPTASGNIGGGVAGQIIVDFPAPVNQTTAVLTLNTGGENPTWGLLLGQIVSWFVKILEVLAIVLGMQIHNILS